VNVGELKKILESLPDTMEVVCAGKGDPTLCSPLDSTTQEIVYAYMDKLSFSLGDDPEHADHDELNEAQWKDLLSSPKSLILRPREDA
jgi:hypothetical protein